MPKLADHAERRAHILTALLRIAADRGLHAVSMRTVAAEAGVTVSTVQHYFHNKEQLLFAGLQHLAEAVAARAAAIMPAAGSSTRDVLRAWLVQFIPADNEQRRSYTVYAAYHALALTDPALAALPYTDNTADLQHAIADHLRTAQTAGETAAGREPDAEAALLLALATGLGDSVMAAMRTPEDAVALLDYHLEHLFHR